LTLLEKKSLTGMAAFSERQKARDIPGVLVQKKKPDMNHS
jgi:hypothetical protein